MVWGPEVGKGGLSRMWRGIIGVADRNLAGLEGNSVGQRQRGTSRVARSNSGSGSSSCRILEHRWTCSRDSSCGSRRNSRTSTSRGSSACWGRGSCSCEGNNSSRRTGGSKDTILIRGMHAIGDSWSIGRDTGGWVQGVEPGGSGWGHWALESIEASREHVQDVLETILHVRSDGINTVLDVGLMYEELLVDFSDELCKLLVVGE